MNIHIGICDDEEYYVNQLRECVEEYVYKHNITTEISIYSSGMELLNENTNKLKSMNIVFLDIDMPDCNGIETAKQLRTQFEQLVICFVTSYDNFSFSAYQVDALGYTLKPAQYENIAHFMKKAMVFLYANDVHNENKNRYIEINIKKQRMAIDINKILYIEKQRNQCVLHCEGTKLICYETLENLYLQLDLNNFLYTNQGCIVNLAKVREITKAYVYLCDDSKISISRNKYKGVYNRYIDRLLQKQNMNINKR